MAGRPELPNSYVVDLNDIVKLVYYRTLGRTIDDFETMTSFLRYDIDIVIPVYESLKDDTAKNIVWCLDNKIYFSNKSRFVEYLETTIDNKKFYIYDKFKSGSYSHKNSYKQLTYDVPYVDITAEHIYLPVYWRVN